MKRDPVLSRPEISAQTGSLTSGLEKITDVNEIEWQVSPYEHLLV